MEWLRIRWTFATPSIREVAICPISDRAALAQHRSLQPLPDRNSAFVVSFGLALAAHHSPCDKRHGARGAYLSSVGVSNTGRCQSAERDTQPSSCK